MPHTEMHDMTNKTSLSFFEDVPVRAVWDEESAKWWFCAMDIAETLTKSKNPRVYWATVKRRNQQLIAICKQLKLKAKDGKFYNTDVVDENGINTVIALIPSKKSDVFAKWMKNMEEQFLAFFFVLRRVSKDVDVFILAEKTLVFEAF